MMEDEYGRELLRPLLAEPVPPSGLDVDGVVREGRTRVRTRRLLGTAGAATAVLVAIPLTFSVVQSVRHAPPAQTPQGLEQASQPAPTMPEACVPAALPVPEGAVSSHVIGGDPTGRYLVGWAASGDGVRTPLLWDRGTLIALEPPAPDVNHIAVNSAGTVVGTGVVIQDGTLKSIAWVYRDGKYSILPQPGQRGWEFVSAVAINERGDILGSDNSLDEDAGQVYPQQLPLIWPADAPATFRRLTAPAGEGMVRANGIDGDGTVVGARISMPPNRDETADRFSHALVWSPKGTVRQLDGDSLAAISDHWVAGFRKGSPFRWNLRTGASKPIRLAFATAINAHGWVAGQADQGNTRIPAVDFGTGKVMKLPMPDGAVPGSDGVGATLLSDDGRVIGGTVAAGPDRRMAVQWSCS